MRAIVRGVLAAALLLPGVEVSAQSTETPIALSLPAQSLRDALNGLAGQTGLQIIYTADDVAPNLTAPRLEGSYTPAAALDTLLKNSGLTFEFLNSRTVAIGSAAVTTKAGWARTSKVSSSPAESSIVLARAEGAEPASTLTESTPQSTTSSDSDKPVRLEEVVVTGSHIRGVQNLGSPVIAFDRKDIEASGSATTQELVRTLTQNLNNVSDMTFDQVNGGMGITESYGGSGINLRGLGGDATLVLINGRRIAASGNGSFVDISLIPLAAIERVEILTDGASAIYGSDAVGGVVNLILRKDFSGVETTVRYGTVTSGDHDESQAAQVMGGSWDSGQAMLSYEYYRRTELLGADRASFAAQPGYYEEALLIPGQKRHGAVATVSQNLGDLLQLSADLFYARRDSVSGFIYGADPYEVLTEGRQRGASLSLSADLGSDWQARLSGLVDETESYMEQRLRSQPAMFTEDNNSKLRSFDLAADGALLELPAGALRLAVGGQHRLESLDGTSAVYQRPVERDVNAIYAEASIPVVSSSNRFSGVESLDLSLAGRYEEYSDFGSTFNPKVGVSWRPVGGLNIRGTWGTSFKAPLLLQVNPNREYVYAILGQYRKESGPANIIMLSGSRVDLQPEESTNFTVGFDLAPQEASWSLAATYFDIDYTDRIRTPFYGGYDTPNVLLDPAFAVVYDRHPDPGYLMQLMAHPGAVCITADYLSCPMPAVSEIDAVLDSRYRNLAGVRQKGLDFSLEYEIRHDATSWRFQLSGSHLLDSVERLVPSAPPMEAMNNVWRPVDTRLRGTVVFERGALSLAGFVNYVDGYPDRRAAISTDLQRTHVASWTTVDTTVQIKMGSIAPWLSGSTLALSASNLLDRDPPYAANDAGFLFDGVNANARGRFISLQVNVAW